MRGFDHHSNYINAVANHHYNKIITHNIDKIGINNNIDVENSENKLIDRKTSNFDGGEPENKGK